MVWKRSKDGGFSTDEAWLNINIAIFDRRYIDTDTCLFLYTAEKHGEI